MRQIFLPEKSLTARKLIKAAGTAALSGALLISPFTALAASTWVTVRGAGDLDYKTVGMGDRIPDFSTVGYRAGGIALPEITVKLVLEPSGNGQDDTSRIQAALKALGEMPANENGHRGALLLRRGHYTVSDTLRISHGGVVLRGEGDGEDGTILKARAGNRYSVISVSGVRPPEGETEQKWTAQRRGNQPWIHFSDKRLRIVDDYVPVGADSFTVESVEGLSIGDDIVVIRNANDAWISEIGMDAIPPRPSNPSSTRNWDASSYNIGYQRVITRITDNRVKIDSPIVCAIDQRWGGGGIYPFLDMRIAEAGVEHLRIVADFDRSVTRELRGERYYAAENQARQAVTFGSVKNGWARNITSVHTDTCVRIEREAKWITVQDSTSLAPVSVITGGRRYAFNINGEQILVQRCVAEDSRHGFAFGSRVPGPNVILDSKTVRDYAASEPHHRWSTGGLYDNFNGRLYIQDRAWYGSGHGWSGANYVVWNSRGTLVVQSPPTAQNWSIGHVGERQEGAHAPRPQGIWESHGNHVTPRSLYLAQLRERLGSEAVLNVTTEAQRKGRIDDELRGRINEIPFRPPEEDDQ